MINCKTEIRKGSYLLESTSDEEEWSGRKGLKLSRASGPRRNDDVKSLLPSRSPDRHTRPLGSPLSSFSRSQLVVSLVVVLALSLVLTLLTIMIIATNVVPNVPMEMPTDTAVTEPTLPGS